MSENINETYAAVIKEENEKCFEDTPPEGMPPYKRDVFKLLKSDYITAGILVFLSIFGVFAGAFGGFNLGFTVSFIPMLLVLSVYLWGSGGKIKAFPLICGIAAVALAFVFPLGAATSVKWWIFVLIFICSAVWLDSLAASRAEQGDLGVLYNLLYTSIGLPLGNCVKAVASIFVAKKDGSGKFGKALIGMLLSLPALLIIVPILISSDAAFEGLVSGIIGGLGKALLKTVLGLALSCLVLGYAFAQRKESYEIPKRKLLSGIDPTYVISFLSLISLCYVLYLFSQLAYFFKAFSGLLPEEFTSAEYARRGFFEMCVIAGINLGLVLISLLITRKKDGKVNKVLKIIGTFISLFTLIIISTALSKMFLYINSFGMTVLRITTSAFMIFLAIVFISVIIRCYTNAVNVIKTAIVTAAAVLAGLGFMNVEACVAAYNYNAWKTEALGSIDIDTIYELGDEGVPYLIILADSPDPDISSTAENYLLRSFEKHYEYDFQYNEFTGHTDYTFKQHKYSGFEKWNRGRARAYLALDKYLKDNPDFSKNRVTFNTDREPF